MSAVAEPILERGIDDNLARYNAKVLAVAQALAGANNTVIVATGSIAGAMFAPDKGLATLPITLMVLGMWIGTVPTGMLAKARGRRFALQTGSVFGVLSGLISCAAVLHASFTLLLLGAFCGGLYAAAHQSYRFAAADTASAELRPKVVSMVLAGGIFAAVIGPQLVITTKDLWQPYLFAATFVAQSAVAVLAAIVLAFLRIPRVEHHQRAEPARPLAEIASKRRFVVAVVCGVVSYSMMNMLMTSAPLAMVGCGHSVTDASLGIQWHVLAMYGPSFITGSLIVRFGVTRVVLAGLALMALAGAVGISGISVAHFWAVLILLGLGWNLSFVGATTMITHCHRPSERNKVQAFNDFLIFGSMALASFASGKMLAVFGWAAINEVVFPAVLVAAILVLVQAARSRPQPV